MGAWGQSGIFLLSRGWILVLEFIGLGCWLQGLFCCEAVDDNGDSGNGKTATASLRDK